MKYKVLFTGESIFIASNKEIAIRNIDTILMATNKFSLLSALNDVQIESVNYEGSDFEPKPPFNSKWTIPDYFINIILQKYNVRIEAVRS